MRSLLLALPFALGGVAAVHAQYFSATTSGSSKGAELDTDGIVGPFVSYSPTTKLALGGAAGCYTLARPGDSSSEVEISLKVTQRRQISAEIDPELY